ncbi:hypothetical protein R0381_000296 [Jeongeupia wiesaeckerbachi]|uniref:hypothetical protein n=1 Tax=Jeongeupia wiesaeckerbachi TaxID=3051218 RepID=UPI003D802419
MMRHVLVHCGLLLCLLGIPSARAEPFRPHADAQVIEILPRRDNDALNAGIARLRLQLNAAPTDFAIAGQLAGLHLKRFRRDGDPRDLGQADALIAPWLNGRDPPATALLLHASVQQSNHRFAAALASLDSAMRKSPGDPQALLMRAGILQVQGKYADARQSCGAMLLQNAALAGVCLANVSAVSGQPEQALALLRRMAAQAGDGDAANAWVMASIGETAASLGLAGQAEDAFRKGLRAHPDDAYLKTAMADFLLEHRRPREVIALLAGDARNDNLLLRLTMAEQQLGDANTRTHIAELQARFAAAAERGDRVHLREEAMFRLVLLNQAEAALQLAKANWAVQKEVADCRILLAAALAARQPAAARPALEWLATARLRAPALLALQHSLQGKPAARARS